jgi:hypothetical protein
MKPFEVSELIKDKPIASFFKTNRKQKTLLEIKNYLARAEIENIDRPDIESILENNGLANEKISKELGKCLEDYVSHSFLHLDLNKIEKANFEKFAAVLGLNFEDLQGLIDQCSKKRLRVEMGKVFNNGKSIEDNQGELAFIQEKLFISDDYFKEIADELRIKIAQDAFKEVTKDGEYTPEEETQLQDLYSKLQIDPHYDVNALKVMDKGRMLWKIRNEKLPVIKPDINLQSSEVCHYSTLVDYCEYKTIITKVGYAGPAFRVKILKGFYYKAGNYNVARSTEEKLVKIDTGKIYVTNKRIIFVGSNRTINIRLNRILDVELFSDGVKIVKDAGRNVLLAYQDDTELLGLLLVRAMSDYQSA